VFIVELAVMINPSNVTTPCIHANHCLSSVRCKYMQHCHSMHSPGTSKVCYSKLQRPDAMYKPIGLYMSNSHLIAGNLIA